MIYTWISCFWVAQQTLLAQSWEHPFVKRGSTPPNPISVSASQNWDGDDGPWSSFTIQVGTPVQDVRVFVSASSPDTWVVRTDGCLASDSGCVDARGRTFNPNSSTTWTQDGYYQLGVDQNLGLSIQGVFGNDTVGLGIQGSGGPVLQKQIVAAYTSQDLYLGMFGLNPAPTNFSATDQGRPSYMASLKEQNVTPSLSFGYTAGNQYSLKQVYGSLTLGGYDSSLFTSKPLSIPFAADPTRNLMVAIQSIVSEDQNGTSDALLSSPIMANVDSTVSVIYLPLQACQAFEKSFGLVWDQKTQLYLVDDNLHSALQTQNATVTFTLGETTSGGNTTNITLPYNSFDLTVKPPAFGVSSSQKYFPLRRAANDTQYTLGRTFLQEAYLTVDWERRNFSLVQCEFVENAQQALVPISPLKTSAGDVSIGEKVGIAVGVVVAVATVIGVVAFFLLRRRKNRRQAAEKTRIRDEPSELIRQGFAKGELGTGFDNERYEMMGDHEYPNKPEYRFPEWVDEKARYPGDRSGMAEADGATVAELASRGGFVRPLHEMYDPSTHPVQAPVELDALDAPRELPAVRTARNSAVRSTRHPKAQTPLSHPTSPISEESPHPSPINRQSNRSAPSRSSIFGSLNRSSAPSPAQSTSSQRHFSRGQGPSSSPSRPPDRMRRVSPPDRSPPENFISPVSRQGHFSPPSSNRSGSNPVFSPISPVVQSPEAPQGLWERLRWR